MTAVYKKELQSYFFSPIAYVFMGIFLLISGFFFSAQLNSYRANFNSVLGSISFLFLLVVPILTMRLLGEERKNKTDQLLLTSPLSLTDIVLGKFFAACTVFLATLVITLVYPLVLSIYGNPSLVEIISGLLGFFLLGCSLIAVGVFISSLAENQVTAAVITFGVLLLMYLGGSFLYQIVDQFLRQILGQEIDTRWIGGVLQWLSVYERLGMFTQAVLSLTRIVYYISFAAVFLFLTIRTVERRRWSEV